MPKSIKVFPWVATWKKGLHLTKQAQIKQHLFNKGNKENKKY